MSTSAPVVAGATFTASIPVPPGPPVGLGARVETPVVAAIVGAWQPASIGTDTATVVLEAPLNAGAYVVHWITADDHELNPPAFQPLTVVGTLADGTVTDWPDVDPDAVRPDMSAVALLERVRTVDQRDGSIVGEFNDHTNPTAAQVDGLIDAAVDDVLSELRPNLPPERYRQLTKVITYYAAMLVEGSFFGEQQTGQGGRVRWSQEYADALANLTARIEQDITEHNLLGTLEPRDTPWLLG